MEIRVELLGDFEELDHIEPPLTLFVLGDKRLRPPEPIGQLLLREAGALTERLAYDPHGKRRVATWEPDPLNLVTGGATPRGFTGHEHLDDVGLIHMNGRVYDPVLGRFLSADPFVQFPKSTQGLNRYTYVNNNPLSYTDPSGFFGFLKKIFRAVTKPFRKVAKGVIRLAGKALKNPYIRLAAAVAGAYVTAGLVTHAIVASTASAAAAAGASAQAVAAAAAAAAESIGTAILSGAAGGFVGGLIGSGGDLQSAFIGGLAGAAIGFVGGHSVFGGALSPQRVAAHGLIGGVSSTLRGGKFITGALTGAVAKLATPVSSAITQGNAFAGAIAQATVGGVTNVLGGGKFANGVITGAFGYLFNECANGGCGSLVATGFTKLPGILNAVPAHHTLTTSTDTYSGAAFATRAGPGFGDKVAPSCATGGFVCAQSGPFDSSFADAPNDLVAYQRIGILSVSPEAMATSMRNFTASANAQRFAYGGFFSNSNSYSSSFSDSIGLSTTPVLLAPGFGGRLLPRFPAIPGAVP